MQVTSSVWCPRLISAVVTKHYVNLGEKVSARLLTPVESTISEKSRLELTVTAQIHSQEQWKENKYMSASLYCNLSLHLNSLGPKCREGDNGWVFSPQLSQSQQTPQNLRGKHDIDNPSLRLSPGNLERGHLTIKTNSHKWDNDCGVYVISCLGSKCLNT